MVGFSIDVPHGQSTWHSPQNVGQYRAYINQYMVTGPSTFTLVYVFCFVSHQTNNAGLIHIYIYIILRKVDHMNDVLYRVFWNPTLWHIDIRLIFFIFVFNATSQPTCSFADCSFP